MALTTERIRELWENYSPTKGIESFARSIEAEVRKQNDALILQLVEALCEYAKVRKQDDALIQQLEEALTVSSPHTDRDYGWKSEDWTKRRADALAAARERLEGKP